MAVKKEVSIEVLKKAEKMLAALPVKEPAKKLLDDVLDELKPQIESALKKGYSQAELVVMLSNQGVPIKAYRLKELLATARPEKQE